MYIYVCHVHPNNVIIYYKYKIYRDDLLCGTSIFYTRDVLLYRLVGFQHLANSQM